MPSTDTTPSRHIPPAYLPPPEAGAYLGGFTSRVMTEWRRRGTGPRYSRIGGPNGRVRYAVADLDAWMASQRHTSTSDESAGAAA